MYASVTHAHASSYCKGTFWSKDSKHNENTGELELMSDTEVSMEVMTFAAGTK